MYSKMAKTIPPPSIPCSNGLWKTFKNTLKIIQEHILDQIYALLFVKVCCMYKYNILKLKIFPSNHPRFFSKCAYIDDIHLRWFFNAAQLRLSINSVQTKSTGNVHYDITVYYKPRKYLLIYLLVKLTYTNLLIKNNKCYYLQFWCPLYRTHWKISEMSFSLYYKIWRHMLQNDALS